jgi:alpha-glucosidase
MLEFIPSAPPEFAPRLFPPLKKGGRGDLLLASIGAAPRARANPPQSPFPKGGKQAQRLVLACMVFIAGLAPAAVAASRSTDVTTTTFDGGIEVRHGDTLLRITAITDDILRVRIAGDGKLPEDASWAVPEQVRAAHVAVLAAPAGGGVGFRTASLQVRVEPESQRLLVQDLEGRVVSADAPRPPLSIDGPAFELRKAMPQAEHYFGLGDKTGPLDRRGGAFVDWNTDVGRFTEATDPLYKSIPFFIATGGEGGSYGLFLDNTWRSWFDFGQRDAQTLAFGSDGGPIDYYLIHGPTVKQVLARYTDLTGKPPLAPLWSLGYQQSRYSYMSADEVRGIARRLREERIPTDVIWLDIDFQDRNRPFTTNPKTYPDLAELAADMRGEGIRLVAITDLHVAHAPDDGYAPYDSGSAGDHFVKAADGSVFVGEVWPGPSVFPDFTRATTRAWWGGLYRGFVDAGIAGFWNDMNEPALFGTPTKTMPLDVVHRIDTPGFATRKATHSEIHNVYGMENTRATFEGLRALRPDERAFVMTRASYAGGQRYAATWTGDNSSTWSHLKLSVAQLLNLGLSGFPYSAVDVGGFTGGASAELMTRWFQLATFMPLFRDHSATDAPRAEPWVDGPEHTAIRRRFVEERYRLLPYLYALADENARTGAPLMRPLFYDYPDAASLPCDQSMTFLLGASLLVAASPTPESSQDYRVCLPAGGWYDYWTGLAVAGEGDGKPATLTETPKLERLPVFVRAGTLLPRQPLVQSTQQVPDGPLTLDVYPGDDCEGMLYADDGHSMAHAKGSFLRQRLRCATTENGLEIGFDAREGDFVPWWKRIEIVVHGWQGAARVETGRNAIESIADAGARTLRFTIDDQRGAAEVAIGRL